MGVTKKDLENVARPSAKFMAVLDFLARLLRPIFRLGFIRRRLDKSVGGRVGAIARCAERGQHDKAAQLAIQALKEYRDQPAGNYSPSGRDFWWFFMKLAAESLEHCDDHAKWDELIELANSVSEPFEDNSAASYFLSFSRWNYNTGDYDTAIEFAEIAARTDETWAEPDFVLGRYRLAIGGGDAVEHLTRAIRKDHRILFRIASDEVCRQNPHIVQKLKELSKDRLVTVGDKPGNSERGGKDD